MASPADFYLSAELELVIALAVPVTYLNAIFLGVHYQISLMRIVWLCDVTHH